MKKKFYTNCAKVISVLLILTCSALFSEKAIGQSNEWEDIETASNTAAILGALAGVCMVATIILLVTGNSHDDDDEALVKKTKKKKSAVKDSTTVTKPDTSSVKKKETGK